MGREVGEAAQGCVQAALLPGEEGHPHMLHLQPGWEARSSWLPGRHHPDLGQKPQRESSNTLTNTMCRRYKHRTSVLLWLWEQSIHESRVIWSQGREVRVQRVTSQH